MHKTLTATAIVALLGAASAAHAADIYSPGYKDGPIVAYPNWTGYYIGAHVGGVWSTIDFNDMTGVPAVPFNNDTSGFFGGGQIGYAYQLGNLVIGPEVDIGGMGLSHSVTEVGGLRSGGQRQLRLLLRYYRPSWLCVGSRRSFYIKGGYAYYGGSLSVSDAAGSVSHSDLSGWTGGGGVEYKINPAWSLKAEYQFFEFNTFQLIIPGVSTDTYDDRFTAQTFKVGANYHFCAPYQPLK